MTDSVLKLKQRIKELEAENELLKQDKDFTDAVYLQAKKLASASRHLSPITLQKKYLIDFPRANFILTMLKNEGLVD